MSFIDSLDKDTANIYIYKHFLRIFLFLTLKKRIQRLLQPVFLHFHQQLLAYFIGPVVLSDAPFRSQDSNLDEIIGRIGRN